jgi:iron complex outermembrane receptor protein
MLGRTTAAMALVTQFSSLAMAQEAATPPAEQVQLEEIIVTGTQLRGIAPVGTNVVSVSEQEIIATGAPSANDILTKIPQVSSAFLSTPTTALDAGLALIRPNIRNLGASGTSTTLVIIDGHRVVGAGALQSTPDPDVIPPGVLERIDIVPDGGSSIYGSDAIGGVINYISKRRFDGLEVSGRTGFADDYQPSDVNVTAGKDWGSGSGYVSYAWAHNDSILGKDRDYLRQVTPNSGYCGAGTILANGTTYANTGTNTGSLTPGTMTSCDTTDEVSLWPEQTRHNVFGSLNQEITDSVTLDVRGYYARRELTLSPGLDARDLAITAANPFFDPIAGETSQTVRTNFLGVIDQHATNTLTSYGVTPTLTVALGENWQLRALANFGRSETEVSSATVNVPVAQTTLNPYDLRSNSAAALSAASLHNLVVGEQKLSNYRAILDGSVIQLPGGDVRLAIGAEYMKENHDSHNGVTAFGAEGTTPTVRLDRDIESVFAEIAVPIVGTGNAISGVHSLTFSASGRYDDYSDVGGTFNPNLGVTYEPLDWIKVRGNWGKSFNAPSLVDKTGTEVAGGIFSFALPYGQTAPWAIAIAGNSGTDMEPQTATTYSIGADFQPPMVPGLTLSATYYNIDLKKVIGLLAGQPYSPELEPFLRDNVPCAQAAGELAGVSPFPPLVPVALTCLFSPTTAVFDWRVQNLGEIKTDGIDFNVSYDRSVGFGLIYAGLGGTYTLNRDRALVPGAPFVEYLDNPGTSRLSLILTAGAQVGNFNASASLNHRGGYDIDPVVAANPSNPFPEEQNHVDSFTTVDLFFNYKLPEAWVHQDLNLSLNVTNLFNEDPPFYSGGCFSPASCGFTNGSTLGRLIQLGLRIKL